MGFDLWALKARWKSLEFLWAEEWLIERCDFIRLVLRALNRAHNRCSFIIKWLEGERIENRKGMGWLLGRRPCIHSGERACTNNVICSAFNIKLCETVLCLLKDCPWHFANQQTVKNQRLPEAGRPLASVCSTVLALMDQGWTWLWNPHCPGHILLPLSM